MDSLFQAPAPKKDTADVPAHIHREILIVRQTIKMVELLPVWYERQWMNAFLLKAILFLSEVMGRRLRAAVPPAFQVFAG